MKNFILLLLMFGFAASLLAACCCHVPPYTPVPGISIKKNGNIVWDAVLVDTIKIDTLILYGMGNVDKIKIKFYLDPAITQTIYLPGKPYTPYVLKKYEAQYYLLANASHSLYTYKLDSTAVNTIDLTYGPQDYWLSGNFNLFFKLTKPTGNFNFDTTRVNFSGGSFILKLHN